MSENAEIMQIKRKWTNRNKGINPSRIHQNRVCELAGSDFEGLLLYQKDQRISFLFFRYKTKQSKLLGIVELVEE